MADIGHKKTKL